jgi:hypothetical protein
MNAPVCTCARNNTCSNADADTRCDADSRAIARAERVAARSNAACHPDSNANTLSNACANDHTHRPRTNRHSARRRCGYPAGPRCSRLRDNPRP